MPIATRVLVRCSGAIAGTVRRVTCGVPHVATISSVHLSSHRFRSTGQSCLPNDRKSELALDYTLPVLTGSVTIYLSPLTLPSTKSGYH